MKIACLESLEFLLTKEKKDLHAFSYSGSPCESLFRKRFGSNFTLLAPSAERMAKIWDSETKVSLHSDLGISMKKNGLKVLQIDTRSSFSLEDWAAKRAVSLAVTPWAMQRKLENKIYFDAFARKSGLPLPEGIVLRRRSDIHLIKKFPVVLQVPFSEGSRGTFLAKDAQSLVQIILKNGLSMPLLCRQYIANGRAFGVSLLIGPNNTVFSALRMQIYSSASDGAGQYQGIQWVRRSVLPAPTLQALNENMKTLSKALREKGFRGVANIDFIVRGDKIFLIECNPRLGGATPQLAARPELLHGLSFVREFAAVTTGGELSKNREFVPSTSYEGFNMDVDTLISVFGGRRVASPWRPGFYRLGKGLIFVSEDAKRFGEGDSIFVYHGISAGKRIDPKTFFGFVMGHFSLLNAKGDGFSAKGLLLRKEMLSLFKGSLD